MKTREMVFTAIAVSQDSSQATFKLKKTYRGKPPNRVQILPPKEECDTGPSGVIVGETYMFAFSKEGDPTVLNLGYCDAPLDERYYKLEAKFLKSFKFHKAKNKK